MKCKLKYLVLSKCSYVYVYCVGLALFAICLIQEASGLFDAADGCGCSMLNMRGGLGLLNVILSYRENIWIFEVTCRLPQFVCFCALLVTLFSSLFGENIYFIYFCWTSSPSFDKSILSHCMRVSLCRVFAIQKQIKRTIHAQA